MTNPEQPARNVVSIMPSGRKGVQAMCNLARLRLAVAGAEHEDATLTGMTRSLDRRLLALNLQPVAPPLMKVA